MHIRAAVFARDKGICAVCRIDTTIHEGLWRSFVRMRSYKLCEVSRKQQPGVKDWWRRQCQCFYCVAAREALKIGKWEADHIVPVAEGGGLCGLDNYRTLCLGCHHIATADLLRRLAAARRSHGE